MGALETVAVGLALFIIAQLVALYLREVRRHK